MEAAARIASRGWRSLRVTWKAEASIMRTTVTTRVVCFSLHNLAGNGRRGGVPHSHALAYPPKHFPCPRPPASPLTRQPTLNSNKLWGNVFSPFMFFSLNFTRRYLVCDSGGRPCWTVAVACPSGLGVDIPQLMAFTCCCSCYFREPVVLGESPRHAIGKKKPSFMRFVASAGWPHDRCLVHTAPEVRGL